MLENIWNNLKTLFEAPWVENHLLYFSILGVAVILILVFKILSRISRDIKEMDKTSKKRSIDYIRKTSKHNKDNERKQLKF